MELIHTSNANTQELMELVHISNVNKQEILNMIIHVRDIFTRYIISYC